MDRFGASDAWLMFAIWATAEGHPGAALIAFAVCALYCFLPDPKEKPASVSRPQAKDTPSASPSSLPAEQQESRNA